MESHGGGEASQSGDALREFVERVRGADRRAKLDATAARVIAALDRRGVHPVLLKGPALAHSLYDAGEHRGYSDVDLLVCPRDLEAARDVLSELGYADMSRGLGIDDVAGILHAETWSRPGDPAGPEMIDLHRTLPGCDAPADVVWEALSARSDSIELEGRRVAVLNRPAMAMHLATHAAQHGPTDAKAMGDLTRGIHRWPRQIWLEAALLARRVQAEQSFAAGLRLVVGDRSLADELGLEEHGETQWVINNRAARPRGTFHLQALVDAPTTRRRASVLRRSLLPRRDWIVWQHPWADASRAHLAAAYALHIIRAPVWAWRAWAFRRRGRRAGR